MLPSDFGNIILPRDLGYIGEPSIKTPTKKPRSSPDRVLYPEDFAKKGELSLSQKKKNKEMAADRIFVEHLIRLLKMLYHFRKIFIKKEINRGHLAQAIVNYQAQTLSPLVELLGMIYRPYRYDLMNLKYCNRDFPPEVVARVEQLYCVTDIADLARKQQLAEEMFAETLPRVEKILRIHCAVKD